jgi:hypothetical protein
MRTWSKQPTSHTRSRLSAVLFGWIPPLSKGRGVQDYSNLHLGDVNYFGIHQSNQSTRGHLLVYIKGL